MIIVTKLNDVQFVLNSDMIETVFETPDTTIHLTNGNLYIVKEKMEEIIEKTIAFRQRANMRLIELVKEENPHGEEN